MSYEEEDTSHMRRRIHAYEEEDTCMPLFPLTAAHVQHSRGGVQ
jgi:hypothetical protein